METVQETEEEDEEPSWPKFIKSIFGIVKQENEREEEDRSLSRRVRNDSFAPRGLWRE